MEGVNKKLSLFGNYVDIFRGIPFAAVPRPLENPERHPGWQGGSGQVLARPRAGGAGGGGCPPHAGPAGCPQEP